MRAVVTFVGLSLLQVAVVVGPAYAGVGPRPIVVFVSERIGGRQIASYFSSLPNQKDIAMNGCEEMITSQLKSRGYLLPEAPFTSKQQFDARKLRAVFLRYADADGMPNDMIAKAGGIALPGVEAVAACGIHSEEKRFRRKQSGTECAVAECKMVDAKTKRRFATASGKWCVPKGEGTSSSAVATDEACRQIGIALAEKLGGREE